MTADHPGASPWNRAAAIADALSELGDPKVAIGAQRYLKSSLTHRGVLLPQIRKTVRTAVWEAGPMSREELRYAARALWDEPVHENRIATCLLLEAHVHVLEADDTDLILDLLRDCETWALVDPLAVSVAGRLLLREPVVVEELRSWARQDAQWVRRAGILGFLAAVSRPQSYEVWFPTFGDLAEPLLSDRRFFIGKALGWVLRQAGKTEPHRTTQWLVPRAAGASGLTVREAIRLLPEDLAGTVRAARRQQIAAGS